MAFKTWSLKLKHWRWRSKYSIFFVQIILKTDIIFVQIILKTKIIFLKIILKTNIIFVHIILWTVRRRRPFDSGLSCHPFTTCTPKIGIICPNPARDPDIVRRCLFDRENWFAVKQLQPVWARPFFSPPKLRSSSYRSSLVL